MDSTGDDNRKSTENVDTAPSHTQPIDSSGGETDVEEDAFDTQVVDIAGETQVLDFADETQVLDDLDWNENINDTQLVDYLDTQVVSDTESEGTDGTEVLSNGECDELSNDGDLATNSRHCLSNGELNEHTSISRHNDASTGEQHGPGSARFTLIRAASLRASGLAARSRGLNETGQELPEPAAVTNNGTNVTVEKEVDQACQLEEQNVYRRIGGSTVRKLFMEDSLNDNERISNDSEENVDGEHFLHFPVCDNGLAGLSYVDSQELGDLTQAHALEFVDNFVQNNFLEFDHELDHATSTGGKSKPLSSAKGFQMLAMKADHRSTVGETRIFDWDDNQEDEGGGEIFVRKKEEFLGIASCDRAFSKTRKPKGSTLVKSTDKKKQPNADKKTMFHSDSRLLSRKSNLNKKAVQEPKIVKNLANDFAEQAIPDFPGEQFEANVGFDTQLAADALESLCNRDDITNHVQSSSEGPPEGSPRQEGESGLSRRQSSRQKRACLSVEGTTRRSEKTKRIDAKSLREPPVTRKRSRNLGKDCDKELVVTRLKRGKSGAGEDLTNHVNESVDITSKANQHQKAVVGLKRRQLAESSEDNSAKKLRLPDKVGGSAPITRQTRQSARAYQNIGVLEKSTSRTNSSVKEHHSLEKLSNTRVTRQSRRNQQLDVEESKMTRPDFEDSKLLNAEDESSKLDPVQCKKPKSSALGDSTVPISYPQGKRSGRNLLGRYEQQKNKDKMGTSDAGQPYGKVTRNSSRAKAAGRSGTKSNASPASSNKNVEGSLDISPATKFKPYSSACTPPSNCLTPVNAASPICMGDEYLKQSCKRNLSKMNLMREINSLNTTEKEPISALKDLRKRRDIGNVSVLFSHHLDEDIIKQQKKILLRAGGSIASSILDASHFVTDRFVRTRNILEAIASGKPVVTHSWLESVGQANYYIDEEAYILRDGKKEREFGFSMPISLARARQLPLLEGRRVLVTPNTKPGKDTISCLVKAVGGQAIERTGRSVLKDDKLPGDLLILSCEDDYAMCEPFLEKGSAVYSSELLLNGIVTQKLEYERHRLFADHVKRTRSTIWLKKADDKFIPVPKLK